MISSKELRGLALVVCLNSLLRNPQLLLHNLGFDPEIGQLNPQTLVFYPNRLSFLFTNLDLFLQHYCSLDRYVVFRFKILQRGCLIARLSLEIIVLHFSIS